MTIHKLQNHHTFTRECREKEVTLELLEEAQISLNKQNCAKFFKGKCKRGGGNVASSAQVENWISKKLL